MPCKSIFYYRQVGTSPFERWYYAGHVTVSGLSSIAPTANQLGALPFMVERDTTLDRLAVRIFSSTSLGARFRLGIYNNDPGLSDIYPTSLLIDAGEVDGDSVAVKVLTISQFLPANNLFWFVTNYNGSGTVTIGGSGGDRCWTPMGNIPNAAVNSGHGFTVASAYGALPDPFPTAGISANPLTTIPTIACRLSS